MDSGRTETTQADLQSALRENVVPVPSAASDEEEQQKTRSSVLELNGYIVKETIGTGAFSNVKKAFSKTLNRLVAVKIVSKQKATKDVLNKFLPREIELVRNLKHVNLIRFHECIETTLRFYIVMQYAENGSLLQLIRKEKYLPEERAKLFFSQLISAVEYIHGMGVVHRDIKCENIVFDQSYTLKLIDFGFARGNMQPVLAGGKIKPVLSKTFCGSHAYASPEILKSVPYQPQLSDIWAVGVVLYTMVIGRLPFSNETNVNVLIKQVSAGPKFPKDRCISDECKYLIQQILRPANVRISIEEMRRHVWLTEDDSGYDDTSIEKRYEKKMRLDNSSSDSSEGSIKVTINNKIYNASPGNRDDNNNVNNNFNSSDNNCTTSQGVQNRKKAVPK